METILTYWYYLILLFYGPAIVVAWILTPMFGPQLFFDNIATCWILPVLYVSFWFLIIAGIITRFSYKQIRTKRFELFLIGIYSLIVLWMYSLPMSCKAVTNIQIGRIFFHRGMPLQFAGLSTEYLPFPYLNLYQQYPPSHHVVWHLPTALLNLIIIFASIYVQLYILRLLIGKPRVSRKYSVVK